MSDLFHPDVPDDYIENVCRVMLAANWHTYQILTKRAARMRELLQSKFQNAARASHIWWGVSVEDKAHGLPRVDLLRQARPSVAFLSVEPLLEDLGAFSLKGIHWVIVGGESGHGARPIEASWVRSVRAQCRAQKVPFFFKQWGGVRKSEAGRILDGKTYGEYPEITGNPVPSPANRTQLMETLAIA